MVMFTAHWIASFVLQSANPVEVKFTIFFRCLVKEPEHVLQTSHACSASGFGDNPAYGTQF
jgi:hypothetical protein